MSREEAWSYHDLFSKKAKRVQELEVCLARVNGLLMDNYPCYDENKCKNCVGDFGEIDYRTCVGYNVLKALRVAEVK